ncbi:hypothetical protein MRX96_047703 [Rhipicephalus microplus]
MRLKDARLQVQADPGIEDRPLRYALFTKQRQFIAHAVCSLFSADARKAAALQHSCLPPTATHTTHRLRPFLIVRCTHAAASSTIAKEMGPAAAAKQEQENKKHTAENIRVRCAEKWPPRAHCSGVILLYDRQHGYSHIPP